MNKPEYLQTLIFLDSGNPEETRHVKTSLGFLDGQTTNPSLVAKNPEVAQKTGALSESDLWKAYKTIAETIKDVIPNGAISVEVAADKDTTFEMMIAQARQINSWFTGVYVKLPITTAGLQAAEVLVSEGIRINMTLCFSQEQAAAVHSATKGAEHGQVFVSPFIGRLDDHGKHGADLIKNILRMYRSWNSHVMVLGASIRSLEHLYECIRMGTDIVTLPSSIIDQWITEGISINPASFNAKSSALEPISFLDLPEQDWQLYPIGHSLTDQGLEKFAEDWNKIFAQK